MKLKANDIKFFKEKLEKIRELVMDGLGRITSDNLHKSTKDASGDLSGYSIHMADQASDNFDREFSLDLAKNEQDILFLIESALKRIEEKVYGQCVECSKLIPKQRLKAVPYAERCIKCKEAEERLVGQQAAYS